MTEATTYTVFAGYRRIAHGDADGVAAAAAAAQTGGESRLIVFADATGRQVEVDPRTSRLADPNAIPPQPTPKPSRGRPRLGVVAREVTLLPRHWEWLAAQPGGASAALRRLVEDARRGAASADAARQAQQALYSAMSALAGDLPRFEDAARALFAADDAAFDAIVSGWPADVADYVARLAARQRGARAAAQA